MGKMYCAAPFCFSTKGQGGGLPEKMFYSFPLKDPERLQVWVNNVGRHELIEKAEENPQKMKNYHLCVDHFDPLQLMNARDPKSKLIKTAIPTIFYDKNQKRILSGILGLEHVAKFHENKSPAITTINHRHNVFQMTPTSINHLARIDLTETQAMVLDQLKKQNIKVIKLMDEETTLESTQSVLPESNTPRVMLLTNDRTQLIEVKGESIVAIVTDKVIKNKLQKVKRQAWRLQNQNVKLRVQVKELKRGITIDKIIEKSTEYLDDGILKDLLIFNLRNAGKKAAGKRFSNNIKSWALKFYKKYPRAYRDYHKDLGLPDRRTLNLYARGSDEPIPEELITEILPDVKDSDDEDLLSEFTEEEIKQALQDDAELSDLHDDDLSDMDVNEDESVSQNASQTINEEQEILNNSPATFTIEVIQNQPSPSTAVPISELQSEHNQLIPNNTASTPGTSETILEPIAINLNSPLLNVQTVLSVNTSLPEIADNIAEENAIT